MVGEWNLHSYRFKLANQVQPQVDTFPGDKAGKLSPFSFDGPMDDFKCKIFPIPLGWVLGEQQKPIGPYFLIQGSNIAYFCTVSNTQSSQVPPISRCCSEVSKGNAAVASPV